jgi:hypothetical protein
LNPAHKNVCGKRRGLKEPLKKAIITFWGFEQGGLKIVFLSKSVGGYKKVRRCQDDYVFFMAGLRL